MCYKYSFSIDSNIIYLTKHFGCDISRIFDTVKYKMFFLLSKYDDNDLNIECKSLFQTSLCIAKLKSKSLED